MKYLLTTENHTLHATHSFTTPLHANFQVSKGGTRRLSLWWWFLLLGPGIVSATQPFFPPSIYNHNSISYIISCLSNTFVFMPHHSTYERPERMSIHIELPQEGCGRDTEHSTESLSSLPVLSPRQKFSSTPTIKN